MKSLCEVFLSAVGWPGYISAVVINYEGGWPRLYFPQTSQGAPQEHFREGRPVLRMVHVHLDERPGDNVLLAIENNSGNRVAALLAGNQCNWCHLQPTVDIAEEIAATLGGKARCLPFVEIPQK